MINYIFEFIPTNRHLSIKTIPEIRCIDFFFNTLNKETFYLTIFKILKRENIDSQFSGVYYHEWLDDGMIVDGQRFDDDELEISDIFNGRFVLKEKQMYELLYNYGIELVKYKSNDFIHIDNWRENMNKALDMLDSKIDSLELK
jgi:hypothetical protein